jgi:hypothetical protein
MSKRTISVIVLLGVYMASCGARDSASSGTGPTDDSAGSGGGNQATGSGSAVASGTGGAGGAGAGGGACGLALSGDQVLLERAGYQIEPDVVWNAVDDRFLAVWVDSREDDLSTFFIEYDIYGQLFEANGKPAAPDFRINESMAAGRQNFVPKVAHNRIDNEYLVVWEEFEQVVARRLDAGGAPLGGDFTVPDGASSTRNDSSPAVAFDAGTKEYLVLWSSVPAVFNGTPATVFARRVSGQGAPLGANITAYVHKNIYVYGLALSRNTSKNEYLAVWNADTDNAGYDAFAQLLSIDGSPIGEAQQMKKPDWQVAPAVAYSPSEGAFLITYRENHNDGSGDVSARRLDASGMPQANDFLVHSSVDAWVSYSSATYDDCAEKFLLAWSVNGSPGSVLANLFGSDGVPAMDVLPVALDVTAGPTSEIDIATAYSSSSRTHLVVFSAAGPMALEDDIYAQALSSK